MKKNIILIIISVYLFCASNAMLKPTMQPAPAIPKENLSLRDYINYPRDENFFSWRVKHFGKHFDFSNLKLSDLADFEKIPSKIKRAEGDLEPLPDLAHVETLSLYSNKLTAIDPKLFPNLPALKTLTLNDNQISSIAPRSFAKFPELIYLELSHNPLKTVTSNMFEGLNQLTDLFLSKTQLQTLPDDIFQQTPALQRIFLNDNKLTHVNPNIFKGLSQLKTVNLKGNLVTNKQELKDGYPKVNFIF